MCLPVNAKERQEQQQQQQQTGGEESEDAAAAKTYEDLQTTLNLLEVVICLNIRRYLQTGRGADDEDEDEDGGWRIGPDGLALLASCPELQVPYFSPPGADDDEEDGDDDD